MNTESKILIGGQALRNLGSSRHTSDTDYLINDTTSKEAFLHVGDVDYLNANGNKFFAQIFKVEEGNEQASAQSLLELKAYSFVQHCQNFNFKKADEAEFDMKFLVREFGLTGVKIVRNYVSSSELEEINKVIKSTRI